MARLDTSSMPKYESTFDAIRKIRAQEGLRGFYKGYGVQLGAVIPTIIVYFGTYEYSKHLLNNLFSEKNNYLSIGVVNFLGGAIAEIISTSVWLPSEIISQRMQIQGPLKEKHYKNTFDCIKQTFRNEGIKGFYRGIGATFLTYVPSGGASWMMYELIKNMISPFFGEEELNQTVLQQNLIHMISGGGAGFFHSIVANPFDIAKTRLQVQHSEIQPPHHVETKPTNNHSFQPKYKNTLDVFRAILKEEGLMGFTKGLTPMIMREVPICAISYSAYELVKSMSKKEN